MKNSLILWDVENNRPATKEQIILAIANEELFINFYVTKIEIPGEVFLDTNSRKFELREKEIDETSQTPIEVIDWVQQDKVKEDQNKIFKDKFMANWQVKNEVENG